MTALTLRDVTIEYSSGGYVVRPINGLDLDVSDGQLVILTDENGFYLRVVPYQGALTYRSRWMRSDGVTDYAPPITVGVPAPA